MKKIFYISCFIFGVYLYHAFICDSPFLQTTLWLWLNDAFEFIKNLFIDLFGFFFIFYLPYTLLMTLTRNADKALKKLIG